VSVKTFMLRIDVEAGVTGLHPGKQPNAGVHRGRRIQF
jgi:hypothetical protein